MFLSIPSIRKVFFTRKRVSSKHTIYYCKHHRKPTKCPCKLKVEHATNTFTITDEHNDLCKEKQGFDVDIRNFDCKDCTREMKILAEKLALDNLGMHPRDIWVRISAKMTESYSTWSGLDDRQVVNLVKNRSQFALIKNF